MYKGHLQLSEIHVYSYDEVSMFLDARFCSSPEAFWRLSEFAMHGKSHTVYCLPVHLPDLQNVYFQSGREEEALARNTSTQLTAWFALNQRDNSANQYLYTEIPSHYIYKKKKKIWKPRRQGADKIISRMYTASPRDREKFALRCLLLHVPGATSYQHLRMNNDIVDEYLHILRSVGG